MKQSITLLGNLGLNQGTSVCSSHEMIQSISFLLALQIHTIVGSYFTYFVSALYYLYSLTNNL